MDSAGEGLEAGEVAGGGGAVVLLGLATVLTAKVGADGGEEGVDVEVLDLGVDVDRVRVEDLGVLEGLEDGPLHGVGEEGVFVGGLVAADQRLQLLLLVEVPVEEAEAAVGDVDGAGRVDCLSLRGGAGGSVRGPGASERRRPDGTLLRANWTLSMR